MDTETLLPVTGWVKTKNDMDKLKIIRDVIHNRFGLRNIDNSPLRYDYQPSVNLVKDSYFN
jgi:hypothetical protein